MPTINPSKVMAVLAGLVITSCPALADTREAARIEPITITYELDYCAMAENLPGTHWHWNIHLRVFDLGGTEYGVFFAMRLNDVDQASSNQYWVSRFDTTIDAKSPALSAFHDGLTNVCSHVASNSSSAPGILPSGCPGDSYHAYADVFTGESRTKVDLNLVSPLADHDAGGRMQMEQLVSDFVKAVSPSTFPVGLGPAYSLVFGGERKQAQLEAE